MWRREGEGINQPASLIFYYFFEHILPHGKLTSHTIEQVNIQRLMKRHETIRIQGRDLQLQKAAEHGNVKIQQYLTFHCCSM